MKCKLKILLFNIRTDADADTQGFTTLWINALAEKVEKIHVITMCKGRLAVAPNVQVYSVGKEKGYSEPRRLLEFYRLLFFITRKNRIDVIFAHMIPIFAILAAPVAKMKRIPLVMWYAHKSVNWRLRLAHWLVDLVVTSSPESFRLASSKVKVIGHGIDTQRFYPKEIIPKRSSLFRVLSVGRISPIKNLEMLIEAAGILVHEMGVQGVQFVLVGGAPPGQGLYAEGLKRRVEELILGPHFRWVGSVPHDKVVSWYEECDLFVNLSDTGSIDKAVLEAMACGKPVLTSNPAFKGWLGRELSVPKEPLVIAQRILQCREQPPTPVRLKEFRRLIVERHSLEQLIGHLVAEFQHLASRRTLSGK